MRCPSMQAHDSHYYVRGGYQCPGVSMRQVMARVENKKADAYALYQWLRHEGIPVGSGAVARNLNLWTAVQTAIFNARHDAKADA